MERTETMDESQQRSNSCCSCLLTPLSFLSQISHFSNYNPATTTITNPTTTATLHEDASESTPPPIPLPPPSSSTSSSSSSSIPVPLPRAEFEVFLSFRGPDTRHGFTDFLYTYLKGARIHTYRDDEELRKGHEIGPELLAAITESKVYIPIFSKDYASSKWCLREVAKMVECAKTMGQRFLPIFYYVEPSDVRHQTGCYAEAFRRHEEDFDERTVQEWREALGEIGKLKGWGLKEHSDVLEGSVVKEVVSTVLSELRGEYMLLTDELVGIHNNTESVLKLLNMGSNEVRLVGIYGMGGIGKTTIATAIYNQLLVGFEHRCFLADIRETLEQYNGLIALQNQLISGILKEKSVTISSDSEGINVIKNRVFKEKLLIVLDDVDNKFKFDKIIGRREWLAMGSKIIITTRDKKVLNALRVDGAYEPRELGPDHSLQLFSKHAFGEDMPPNYFIDLSKDIVATAAGLPLALKVIGSHLFGEKKPVWEETLKLLREIPHDEVQEKLKVSFRALTYEQKQIFLDIACLFIGGDKDIASYMWDDCNFYPTIGINVLVLRSLLKIGEDNKFKMHDQLRDLGRAIVRGENIEDPWKRSRLWSHKDALDTLRRQKGTENVRALSLNFAMEPKTERSLTNEEFAELSNLRFLQIRQANISGNFANNPLFRLRWLDWQMCPGNNSPTNLQLVNLVTLDLSGSKVTNDWAGWSEIKVAGKLKVLDLSYCRALTRTPDLSTFQSLERLNLEGCGSLAEIDPSIRNLKNLRMLRTCGSQIKKLPDDIEALEKLEELDASWCEDLEGEVPANIVRLSSLRILILQITAVSGLPTGLSGLSCLRTLDLEGTNVRWLPELPSSLRKLIVTCTFPHIENLVNLQELRFFKFHEHVDIPKDIWKLSKLEILGFHGSNISILPAEIGKLPRLKELHIISCKNFHTLSGLPSSLGKLFVQQGGNPVAGIERLPGLSHLKNLTALRLLCPKLTKIEGLGGLCCLEEFIITGCKSLDSLDGLEQLRSLRIFFMDECDSLKKLPNLSALRKLKWLDASQCWNLIEIQGIDSMESLKNLCMSDCIAMETLPNLSDLGMLKQLNLCNCQSLSKVEGLHALKSLEYLDMGDCLSLVSLPDLSQLGMLEQLVLNDSQSLREIEGLGAMKSLEILNVEGCIKLEILPDLSDLKNLKELHMNDCIKLTRIPGLEELASLKLLEMNGCKSLQSLPNLSRLNNLEKLCMSGCERVNEIRGLEELRSLALLDISGCNKLNQNLSSELPNINIIR